MEIFCINSFSKQKTILLRNNRIDSYRIFIILGVADWGGVAGGCAGTLLINNRMICRTT